MKLYRFSPLKSADECIRALSYIDSELKKLSQLTLGQEFPVNTLKIFAHYKDEYVYLKSWVDSLGENDGTSTPSYYVNTSQPLKINDDYVTYVGIRTPDPYRSQVGCGDYVVDDYEAFKAKYLGSSKHVREIPHPKFEMLELSHPDFDILGYIVKD